MDEYPTWVGFIFVFNLIVGTGSLLLPKAFYETGYILSTILITFLAFTSYLTVTYVVEALACSNAILKWRRLQFSKRDRVVSGNRLPTTDAEIGEDTSTDDSDDDQRSLVEQQAADDEPLTIQSTDFYSLDEKVELGEMSAIFFPAAGSIMFYICIAVYLYGDLSIYSAAVSTTLRDVICDRNTSISIRNWDEPCWEGKLITRFEIYRICLIAFSTFLSPYVFFNVTKTRYLQYVTMSFRWLAFAIMIVIACFRIVFPPDNEPIPDPPKANFSAVPFLIGSCIYSFMSQHSMPSLLVPIKEKHKIRKILSLDYFMITLLYVTLALTGIFAFADLQDLYTLNFIPSGDQKSAVLKAIDYFLALFPVLTLTTSFPIIAITLRNNLQTLFVSEHQMQSQNFFIRRIIFPVMAIAPPFAVTYFTESVQSLVSFTGCYAGAMIQYIIPIALVYSSRKTCANIMGQGIVNEFKSRFQSNGWLIMILAWTCISLTIVTVNFFK